MYNGWRYSYLMREVPKILQEFERIEVYEFGVYKGDSAIEIAKAFNDHGARIDHFYLFDSFQGLPAETEEEVPEEWKEGAFYLEDLKEKALENVRHSAWWNPNTVYQSTWFCFPFEEGVKRFTSEKIPPAFVHIDCDLYSSTKTVLNWMHEQNLFQPNVRIGFDDWVSSDKGEGRAFREFQEVCDYKFTLDFLSNSDEQRVYRVLGDNV